MDVLEKKLKCSTLIEVTVSMLIISITFILAFSVITNIGKRNSPTRYKAYLYVHKELAETKNEKSYSDEIYKIGNIEIKKTVNIYNDIPNLYKVKIQAYDNNKVILYDYSELITSNNLILSNEYQ